MIFSSQLIKFGFLPFFLYLNKPNRWMRQELFSKCDRGGNCFKSLICHCDTEYKLWLIGAWSKLAHCIIMTMSTREKGWYLTHPTGIPLFWNVLFSYLIGNLDFWLYLWKTNFDPKMFFSCSRLLLYLSYVLLCKRGITPSSYYLLKVRIRYIKTAF